jgi:hypothetical protein
MNYQFTLTSGNDSLILDRDPDGWEDIELTLTRDERWHGIGQEVSVDLGFWCDGGGFEFINALYEQNGADVEILLEVKYCDAIVFTGLLQLNSLIRQKCVINVPVDNFDIGVQIRRRFETPINLEQATTLDGAPVQGYTYGNYDVDMHSRTIFLESQISQSNPFTRQFVLENIPVDVGYTAYFNHGIILTKGDLSTTIDNPSTNSIAPSAGFTNPSLLLQDSNFQSFYIANDPIVQYPLTLDITWDFDGVFTDTATTAQTRRNFGFLLNIYYGQTLDTASVINVDSFDYVDSPLVITRAYNGSGSQVITLDAGDRIWVGWVSFRTPANYIILTGATGLLTDVTWKWEYTKALVNIKSNSTFEETKTKAWAIHELFARVTHSVTNNPLGFLSNYFGRTNSQPTQYGLTGCGGYTAITNGLKLRQYTDERSAIVVSLDDLMESMDSLHGIGWGVLNNKFIVEPIGYFYQDNVIIELPHVPSIEMRIAQDKYVNQIEIGYEKWETEDVNGLEEPNSIHEYSLPQVQRKNKAIKLSPYIGGSYAIESTRRRPSNVFNTTDWKFDNENFILALKHNVNQLKICEKAENFSNVDNLLEPLTTYNLRYSPARNLLRQLRAFTGGLFRKPNADVRFQDGEGNIILEATELTNCLGNFDGALLTENQDFVSGDFAPYWIPEVYTFGYVLSFTEFQQIRNAPYGVVKFSDTDTDWKFGFILNLEYNLKTGEANFELLRANV